MGPGWALVRSAAVDVWQHVDADLLGVVAGKQCSPRGPATGGVVELCVANTVGRESVHVWRGNFAAVAAWVGEAHVVGEEDHKVGWLCGRRGIEAVRGE